MGEGLKHFRFDGFEGANALITDEEGIANFTTNAGSESNMEEFGHVEDPPTIAALVKIKKGDAPSGVKWALPLWGSPQQMVSGVRIGVGLLGGLYCRRWSR